MNLNKHASGCRLLSKALLTRATATAPSLIGSVHLFVCLSVCLSICLSIAKMRIQKNAIFSKSKQFRAMSLLTTYRKSHMVLGFSNNPSLHP